MIAIGCALTVQARGHSMTNKCYTRNLRKDYLSPIVHDLAQLRVKQNIPQYDLGLKLGFYDYSIARWESGSRTPTLFNLHCWANGLNAKVGIVKPTEEDVEEYG